MQNGSSIILPGQEGSFATAPAKPAKIPPYDQLVICMHIRTLNLDGFRDALIRSGIAHAEGFTSDQLLSACHKARLGLINATKEEKIASEEWLRFRNLM